MKNTGCRLPADSGCIMLLCLVWAQHHNPVGVFHREEPDQVVSDAPLILCAHSKLFVVDGLPFREKPRHPGRARPVGSRYAAKMAAVLLAVNSHSAGQGSPRNFI